MATKPIEMGSGITLGNNETLSVYDEGTWTPTITLDSGSPGSTSIQDARYTRIGNVVFYCLQFALGTVTGSPECIKYTLPISPNSSQVGSGGTGQRANDAAALSLSLIGSDGFVRVFLYSGANPAESSRAFRISGHYFV